MRLLGKCSTLAFFLFLSSFEFAYAKVASQIDTEVVDLLKHGRVDEARELLKTALRSSPEDSKLWALMTFCSDEPLSCAERAVRLNGKSALALIALGLAKHARDGQKAGLDELNEAIRLEPSSLALDSRGRVFLHSGELDGNREDRAIADFNRAIQLDHESIAPYLLRGDAYFQKGSTTANPEEQKKWLEKAIESYSAAIKIDPESADAYVLRGQAYDWIHDMKCIEDFSRAIELNPEPDDKMKNSPGVSFPDCFPYMSEAFGVPAPVPNAYSLRARAYKRDKQFAKAIADLTKISAFKDRADLYMEIKEYSDAIADYTSFLDSLIKSKKDQQVQEDVWQKLTAPLRSMCYGKRAAAHAALNQTRDAKEDAAKAIELIERYSLFSVPAADPYFVRGELFTVAREYRKAIADYSKGLQFNPGYAAAYINRASAHFELGDYKEAAADYTKSLDLGSGGADLYMIRGKCFLEMGEFERALADFEKARNLQAQSASVQGRYHRNRADLHIRQGEHRKAVDELTRLITLDSRNADAYQLRANENMKLGDFGHAALDFLSVAILKPLWFGILLVPLLLILLFKVIQARVGYHRVSS